MRFLLVAVSLVLFLLGGCDSAGDVRPVGVSEPAMCEEVDSITMAPIEPTDTFLATTKTIRATIKLSDAPSNTTVTARFYYGDQDKKEIAQDIITTSGTGYISFALNPPQSGWPLGVYEVEFYLGKEMKEKCTFFIKNELPESTAVKHAVKNDLKTVERTSPDYKVFNDKQFGFSLELPSNWTFRVIGQNNDYLFEGPSESEQGEIAIIIQMIDTRSQAPHGTLDEEMVNLINMIGQRDGAKIVKKSVLPLAGQNAPFFLATYPANNQQNKIVRWGHTQLGLQNGPIILLISYAAPREIYQRNVNVFQHMIDSIQLSVPTQ